MKLLCDWCHRQITSVLPQKWGKYHFCSVEHKHYMISGLTEKGKSHVETVPHAKEEAGRA